MKSLVTLFAGLSLALVVACDKGQSDKAADKAADQAAGAAAVQPTPVATAPTAEAEADEPACAGDKERGFCCGGHDKVAAAPAGEVPADAVWTTVSVTGLKCDGCANKIKAALGQVDGVLAVEVDRKPDKTGQVRVAMAPKTENARDVVAPQIAALGYSVTD